MSAKIDPTTGFITGASGSMGGGSVILSNEMKSLAQGFAAWRVATGITKQTGTWFSKWQIKADTVAMQELLHTGQGIGLWEIRGNQTGPGYWRHTPFTMPWCRYTLALPASPGMSPSSPPKD